MNRYKWFLIKSRNSKTNLLGKITLFNFSHENPRGFVTDEQINPERSAFKYFSKTTVDIPSIDANGNLSYQKYESINSLKFQIFESNNNLWLRIEDPPRTTKDFFNALEEALGFGFSISPFQFGQDVINKALTGLDECRLVGLRGIGSSASENFVARIDIASKEGIDPGKILMLRSVNFRSDHATYEVTFKMIKSQVSFAESGQVKITGQLAPHIINRIENILS